MNLQAQIAKHFKEVHFGGNWTWVNLKDSLAGITWQQATTQVYSFNSIAKLVYHINFFVGVATKVLHDKPLTGSDSDKYSFDCPPIQSQDDWEKLIAKTFTDAENFAVLIEQLPDNKLEATFFDEKYGSFYRNLQGIIEHTHYHLGQIVLIKKILLHADEN